MVPGELYLGSIVEEVSTEEKAWLDRMYERAAKCVHDWEFKPEFRTDRGRVTVCRHCLLRFVSLGDRSLKSRFEPMPRIPAEVSRGR